MLKLFEKLGLPIPSKMTIIIFCLLMISIFFNIHQYKHLKDKNDIIKGKDVQISVQSETINSLQNSIKEASQKIKLLNESFNKTEKEYQIEVNKLISNIVNCKVDISAPEIEINAQESFKKVLNDLADSTKKVRD